MTNKGKIKLHCDWCGYNIEFDINSKELFPTRCNCGRHYKVNINDENKFEIYTIKSIIIEKLKNIGNNKTWYAIEKIITNPLSRILYRQLFIEIGGTIPNSKL